MLMRRSVCRQPERREPDVRIDLDGAFGGGLALGGAGARARSQRRLLDGLARFRSTDDPEVRACVF